MVLEYAGPSWETAARRSAFSRMADGSVRGAAADGKHVEYEARGPHGMHVGRQWRCSGLHRPQVHPSLVSRLSCCGWLSVFAAPSLHAPSALLIVASKSPGTCSAQNKRFEHCVKACVMVAQRLAPGRPPLSVLADAASSFSRCVPSSVYSVHARALNSV
jgi:hypothetical protein